MLQSSRAEVLDVGVGQDHAPEARPWHNRVKTEPCYVIGVRKRICRNKIGNVVLIYLHGVVIILTHLPAGSAEGSVCALSGESILHSNGHVSEHETGTASVCHLALSHGTMFPRILFRVLGPRIVL